LKFKSLKTKVLFWFGAATILVLILFNIAIYHFLEQNTKLIIQNKLYNKAVFINDSIKAKKSIEELLENDELKAFDVAIVKEDKIIFKKGDTDFTHLLPFMKDKKSFFVFNQEKVLNGLYIFKITEPFNGAIFFLEQNISGEINKDTQKIKEILMVLEPILFFLLIFIASKLTDKILKSIKYITQTANNIYVTDLSQQIPQPKYDDEIKDLVDSFNLMIQRLKSGVELLEQFNSDVSHELKTPLTVIKGEIEITLNKVREPQYYIKSLETIQNEANQIQTIVDNLLMLTKYTKENIENTFISCSLDSILLETINKYNKQLKDKNIKLHLKKFESVTLDGNALLLGTIFSNLIDNAIKYTPKDKNIFISLYMKKENIYFIIEDEGIGIDKEQLEKVMNRFYRVEESRNKKIKGFGLGLSIVKNSVELHNAKINIDSKKDFGTKIEIIF
jgi:signal transduction histidine kinase